MEPITFHGGQVEGSILYISINRAKSVVPLVDDNIIVIQIQFVVLGERQNHYRRIYMLVSLSYPVHMSENLHMYFFTLRNVQKALPQPSIQCNFLSQGGAIYRFYSSNYICVVCHFMIYAQVGAVSLVTWQQGVVIFLYHFY